MPEVILTLNASKYNSDLTKAMELTEAEAKSAAAAVSKSAGAAGAAGSAAAKKISSEGAKTGKSLKEAIADWRETFSSGKAFEQFAGPLAAVELIKKGIEVAIELAKDLWDYWTTSAEEAAQIAEAQLQNLEKQKQMTEESHKQVDSYMSRLKELSTQESLSNAEKKEAAQILTILNGKYKDLNLTMKDLRDNTEAFDEAQRKLLYAKAQEKIKLLEQEAELNRASTSASANLAYENMGNVLERIVLKLAGSKEGILDELKNTSGKRSNADQIKYLQELLSSATQENEISAIQKLIENTRRNMAISSELESLRSTGYSSQAEYLAAEAAKNQKNRQTHGILDSERAAIAASIADEQEQARVAAMTRAQQKEYFRGKLSGNTSAMESVNARLSSASAALADDEKWNRDTIAAKRKVLELERERLKLMNEQKQLSATLSAISKAESDEAIRKAAAEKTAAENQKKMVTSARQSLLQKAHSLGDSLSSDPFAAALRDFESKKGSGATDEEKELIRKLSDLTVSMKDSGMKLTEIQTNSLTARGGFQSGALTPDRDSITRQIEKNTLKEAENSREIQSLVRRITNLLEG